ncbi:MAG: TIGR00266 family protein [Firmicutes bacterium HGW-Firmicutes-10]|jgi:uncharacterized protein (TIGR00266 family)|nr:MAG: TIGR00266 family protein [Firmicutes bacterium HGW-Firmicutes-10]
MKYSIEGTPLPVVICELNTGETMISEGGSMSWMSDNMKMETTSGGGVSKMFGRMLSGESMFLNRYTAIGRPGMIAFASSFPGSIKAIEIRSGASVVVQKSGFLAATDQVDLNIYFQKKIGAGFFGGEGFIMQKLSGNGTAFIEIDGHAIVYNLGPSQKMIIDTGYLAMMDESCSLDIVAVPGIKNMLFGGEGLFNTVVTGPGKIILQTHPVSNVAMTIGRYLPKPSSK